MYIPSRGLLLREMTTTDQGCSTMVWSGSTQGCESEHRDSTLGVKRSLAGDVYMMEPSGSYLVPRVSTTYQLNPVLGGAVHFQGLPLCSSWLPISGATFTYTTFLSKLVATSHSLLSGVHYRLNCAHTPQTGQAFLCRTRYWELGETDAFTPLRFK